MRILIAEDEFIERKAMRKFIEDHFNDIYVVSEAANGRQAIEQAEATDPDVIFMDIKMPGIDGLEAIGHIHERDPAKKFIMVSAYDTFDYAQKAMRFGIKDYILKPGKKEEIIKALLRMKSELEAEQHQQTERQQSREWKTERFIEYVMRYPVQGDVYDLQQDLFPDMQYGYFLVVMADEVDAKQWHDMLQKTIEHPFVLHESDDLVVVCVMATVPLEKSDILQTAQAISVERMSGDCFIGIGQPVSTLKKMPSSYHEAYAACLQLKLNDKRRYGFLNTDTLSYDVNEMVGQIRDQIEKGNAKEAVLHYKEMNHRFRLPDKETLYINIKELLESYDLTIPYQSMSSLESDSDWQTFINVCAISINEYRQSKQYMSQVKAYLHRHYDKAITLEDAAELVNLSPNYLSNLFKEELGDNFVDYLASIRLKKARKLIQKNAYSLKEISFMVGYKDPNYFSRVFKKYYGESPSQFQRGFSSNC